MSARRGKGRVHIDAARCKGCGLCVAACTQQELRLERKPDRRGIRTARAGDGERCTACGACYVICPDTAITVAVVREREKAS
jgi:2-oxoglutarate ferredoxin oxidoreductase subunit delta